MLVGSGGVVALVIGAWGVLWALRRTPGRPWSAWASEFVALAGGMYGSALLGTHALAALGVMSWVRAEPAERTLVAAETLDALPRPIVAATMALLAVGAVVMALRARHPVPPDAERPTWRWLELTLAGLVALTTVAGLGVAGWLYVEAGAAMTTLRAASAAEPLLRGLMWVGTAAVGLDLVCSAALGAIRAARD